MLGTPKRDRRAEQRAAVRREVLDAAWATAREKGLAQLTLRDVAERVGMQVPSLYSHVASKSAIYDAMFAEAWQDYLDLVDRTTPDLPTAPRARLQQIARSFFDFATEDLARHQLMNQRTLPSFVPSPEAYAPAVAVYDRLRAQLADLGLDDDAGAADLFSAIVGGLVDAQHANDPGGDRYSRLLHRAVDMYANEMGLPTSDTTPGGRP